MTCCQQSANRRQRDERVADACWGHPRHRQKRLQQDAERINRRRRFIDGDNAPVTPDVAEEQMLRIFEAIPAQYCDELCPMLEKRARDIIMGAYK